MTVPSCAPADRRHARLREILAQQGAAGASIRQLHAWLSAEGLNVPREMLARWLAADQAEGLVMRLGRASGVTTWVATGTEQEREPE